MSVRDRLKNLTRQPAAADEAIEAVDDTNGLAELRYDLGRERETNKILIERYVDLVQTSLKNEYDQRVEQIERETQSILAAAAYICTRLGLQLAGREVSVDHTVFDTLSRGHCAFDDKEIVDAMKILVESAVKYSVPFEGHVQVRSHRTSRWGADQTTEAMPSRPVDSDEGIFK